VHRRPTTPLLSIASRSIAPVIQVNVDSTQLTTTPARKKGGETRSYRPDARLYIDVERCRRGDSEQTASNVARSLCSLGRQGRLLLASLTAVEESVDVKVEL
jgi:hypothetical protein